MRDQLLGLGQDSTGELYAPLSGGDLLRIIAAETDKSASVPAPEPSALWLLALSALALGGRRTAARRRS